MPVSPAVVKAEPVMDGVWVSGARLEPQREGINLTASGDTTVVSAVAGKKIRVFAITFMCSATVSVAIKSGGGSTLVEALGPFAAGGGLDCNSFPGWICETVAGEALVMNLDSNVNVRGWLCYLLV